MVQSFGLPRALRTQVQRGDGEQACFHGLLGLDRLQDNHVATALHLIGVKISNNRV